MGVALGGGSDPAEIVGTCPVRVAHTQIKDVTRHGLRMCG